MALNIEPAPLLMNLRRGTPWRRTVRIPTTWITNITGYTAAVVLRDPNAEEVLRTSAPIAAAGGLHPDWHELDAVVTEDQIAALAPLSRGSWRLELSEPAGDTGFIAIGAMTYER